MQRSSIYWCL